MPNPIETMAQDMNLMRQSMAQDMNLVKQSMEAMMPRLNQVEKTRSSTEQLTGNEAAGFSVEEMRDPLTNLVEWINKPKKLSPADQMQENYDSREDPRLTTVERPTDTGKIR